MPQKLFAVIFIFAFVLAAPSAFADDAEAGEVMVEEVLEEEFFDDEDLGDVEETEEIEAASPGVTQRSQPSKRSATGRGQASGAGARAGAETARIGMIGSVGASAATGRSGAFGGGHGINMKPQEQQEPSAPQKKVLKCPDKRNPYAVWTDIEECEIDRCLSDEYMLYEGDAEGPRCFKKCDIWGGNATRVWDEKEQDFDVCGSGEVIECKSGFMKIRERTSSSEIEFWQCVPLGTRYGKCDRHGQINICEFPNGKAQQVCENGYWSACSISRHCNEGFRESEAKEVVTVTRGKDQKVVYRDCIAR
ncbi:MAG: hypothetical protein FWG80_03595 [Alphaproteobacteria bacterium]|nr:hypothetical protein [Alphaproteobacteria bacterium]